MKKIIGLAVFVIGASLPVLTSANENPKNASYYLSNSDVNNKEFLEVPNNFDCVGDIHLVQSLKANNYELRNRRLIVEWINPRDQTEITSDKPSYVEQGEKAFRWTSITLKRPKGGGLFSLMDPAAGMERFIGTWRAKVFLDDEHVETLEFVVEC